MAVIDVKKSLDPGDVYVRAQCNNERDNKGRPKKFRIALDGAETVRTCRCAKEGWVIKAHLSPGKLHIQLFNIDQWNRVSEVDLNSTDVQIDES